MKKIPKHERWLFKFYLFSHALRKNVLYSVFGYMYHCKHSPTCGRYFVSQVAKHGAFNGSVLGLWRVLRCW